MWVIFFVRNLLNFIVDLLIFLVSRLVFVKSLYLPIKFLAFLMLSRILSLILDFWEPAGTLVPRDFANVLYKVVFISLIAIFFILEIFVSARRDLRSHLFLSLVMLILARSSGVEGLIFFVSSCLVRNISLEGR